MNISQSKDITLYRILFGNELTPMVHLNLYSDVKYFRDRIFITSLSLLKSYKYHEIFLNKLQTLGTRITNVDLVETRHVQDMYQFCYEEPFNLKPTDWLYEQLSRCNDAFWSYLDAGSYYNASMMLQLFLLINKTKFVYLDYEYMFNDNKNYLKNKSSNILEIFKQYMDGEDRIYYTDRPIVSDNDEGYYFTFIMNLTNKTYVQIYKVDGLPYLEKTVYTNLVFQTIVNQVLDSLCGSFVPIMNHS
ncbi:DhNV_041 [Dikerogammarus haemobaphes nudivirus]|nr:DhNV_041 [Dikerogammarus haemobaphes nudivirus]